MENEQEYQRAAEYAAAMLSRRPLSSVMLEKKLLEKEIEPDAAAYAVERMRFLGALDDAAFAAMVVRSCSRRGCGVRRIRQELWKRGVPKELAEDALHGFEPDWDAMTALLAKKLRGEPSDRAQCEKAMAALQRRGFTFSEIREAMRLYQESLEDD